MLTLSFRHSDSYLPLLLKTKYTTLSEQFQNQISKLLKDAKSIPLWQKEKVQTDKQWSTKHTHKTKDQVTRTLLKPGGELRCSGKVNSSCSTSGTRRANLVTKPVISYECEKDREMFTTSGTYRWPSVTDILERSTKTWWRQ